MHPTDEEFTELVCYISELKHQFSHKIDEQSIKINDHSEVVDELLWQIRELSDKLRKMTDKVESLEKSLAETQKRVQENSCICHYQNHLIPARYRPNSRSIFSRQTSMISRKSSTRQHATTDKAALRANDTINVKSDDDDIYETIEFNESSSQSHLYTEPYRQYGSIRRSMNVKSRQRPKVSRKASKTLKKSSGMMNLQLLSQSDDEELLIKDDDVELRVKTPTKDNKCLLPDYAVESDLNRGTYTRHHDASGIFINLECLKLRAAREEDDRTTV